MTTFKQVVERVGPLDVRRAARYVVDVTEQLAGIHATGQLHRDVWNRELRVDVVVFSNFTSGFFVDSFNRQSG